MKKTLFVILFIALVFLLKEPDNKLENKILEFDTKMIAHAGGGINNTTYTNSYEALDLNHKKGFRYFEIDFSFTKDKKLVCLHDWQKDFSLAFGKNTPRPVDLQKFTELNKTYVYTKCTLDGLSKWLEKNPNSYIITDVKNNNTKALKIIKEKMQNKLNRFIPQIYDPDSFEEIKELGFKNIIWTLYKYSGSKEDVLDEVENFYGSIALTIPTYKLDKELIKELKKQNINTYTHTINDLELFNKLKTEYEIDNIYTDFLTPKSINK